MPRRSGTRGVRGSHCKVAHPVPEDEAAGRIGEFGSWNVFVPRLDDVIRAIALHKRTGLNFWDAMIVHAAAETGCDVLWTEDVNDGQLIAGVRIRNPFRPE